MFTVQKGALSTPYIGWYQENNFPYEMPRASNFLILAKDSTWQIKGTINDKDTAMRNEQTALRGGSRNFLFMLSKQRKTFCAGGKGRGEGRKVVGQV